ncbi:uncharacterized protein BDZ99DRAFT_562354 [Mytilinidion resinicola]|uniref:Uncharacterized protein n=1 Tax=Mytilinidion resinicola TaxID=574789 RepID=A0A6A6YQS2_9PEZI|nr:uncharacterized protein BDZ99DRAFT_562354 [Mytilinidion resinicola]KAF2811252.1 hypothetical protein BDZ99DRAFT_562354 [Mytilinidion resinicola]
MGKKGFHLAEARKGFDELLRMKPNIPFELCDACQSADSDEPPHPPWLCLHQEPRDLHKSAHSYRELAKQQKCSECSQRRHVHNPHLSCDCPYKTEQKRQQLRAAREVRVAKALAKTNAKDKNAARAEKKRAKKAAGVKRERLEPSRETEKGHPPFTLKPALRGFQAVLRAYPDLVFEPCALSQQIGHSDVAHPPSLCPFQTPEQLEMSKQCWIGLWETQPCGICRGNYRVHKAHEMVDCPFISPQRRDNLMRRQMTGGTVTREEKKARRQDRAAQRQMKRGGELPGKSAKQQRPSSTQQLLPAFPTDQAFKQGQTNRSVQQLALPELTLPFGVLNISEPMDDEMEL